MPQKYFWTAAFGGSMSCKFPFSFIEVFSNGDVYPCCPEYCYYYCLGNIFEQSLEEIWYGSKATALRKRLLSDDHTVCNAMQCFRETMDFLLPEDDIVWDEKPPLPIAVKLSHDKECNCSCITCRDMPIRSSQQELDELNRKIETHFLPLLRNAKVVSLSGAGDPLFSRHSRQLIRRIAETYPSMRFALHTNGQLCTAPLLKELGILNRLSHVQISIHAATCGTYEHIVRGASFQRLMENLAGLRELLDKGNLRKLDLFFVIHNLNMKEIGQFSDLAKQFGANAHFWEYRYWGTELGRDFDAVNVCSPAHPLHEELLSGLRGIADLPHIRLSPVLKGLAHPVKRRPDSQPAVFVHSYYCCGQTDIFKKFRQKGTYCYFEPYKLELGSLHRDRLLAAASGNGSHLPYQMEFSALCRGNGHVDGYKATFHDTVYHYKHLPPDEASYIQGLLDHAGRIGRRPFLGFTRSLLRIGLHKKHFGGLHVMLLRDPYSMFASLLSQEFERSAHLAVLRLATEDSIIRRLGFTGNGAGLSTADAGYFTPDNWELFCEFYVLFHAVGMCHCDMVADTTRLALDRSYAEECGEKLSSATGLQLSFADTAVPPDEMDIFYNPTPLRGAFQRYLGTAQQRQKLIALAEEYADIPATPHAEANLDALTACIFRKTGDARQQSYAQWAQLTYESHFLRELRRLNEARPEQAIPFDDSLRQLSQKLDELKERSLLKAEAKKILRRIFPQRIRKRLAELRASYFRQ